MALIAGRCTQCGGLLEIDSTGSMFVCPYCHTPFVVEKVVNYYNYTRNVDDWVRSAEAFLELKEFSEAEREFERIAREHAYDYRGWWGLVKAKSRMFTHCDISKLELDEVENLYKKAAHFATGVDKNNIQYIYDDYAKGIRRKLQELKKDTSMKMESLFREYERNKMPLENQINALIEQQKKIIRPSDVILKITRSIAVVFVALAILGALGSAGGMIYMLLMAAFLGAVVIGIGKFIGQILDPMYDHKERQLRTQISELEKQVDSITREYQFKRNPLDKLMHKVGNI